MSLFKAITKIVFSPVRIVKEVVDDVVGDNSEGARAMAILTVGLSSVVKGAAKTVKEISDEVFEDL